MSLFDKAFLTDDFDDDDLDMFPVISITADSEESLDKTTLADPLPILALKNTVLFPSVVIPITVGRNKSINAIQNAYRSPDKMIGVLTQQDVGVEEPSIEDLYEMGTVAKILKLIKMPDGTTTAVLQGRQRFVALEQMSSDPFISVTYNLIDNLPVERSKHFQALISSIKDKAQQIIKLSPNLPNEAVMMVKNISQPSFLINFIASNLSIENKEKQDLLSMNDMQEKAEEILKLLDKELQLLQLKNQIETKVRGDIDKQQRDYFLNQQLKTIQEELGGNPQEEELQKLQEKAEQKSWTEVVQKAFEKQIAKVRRTNPMAPDYGISLSYLELLVDLPWSIFTKDNFDLKKAQEILDRDHSGLEKVKDRIIEHLAVLKLKGDMKAPILCLVGPPGVGKTSLGRSVAEALGRKYIRMSLGGLHDESEIRGHRKTYIGAMPGRIIKSLKKVQSSNPVFILDEIDKVGKDFRGDPSSALLEVLDPEQNGTFHDNYLELEYDLSKIMFIATANTLNTIQPALRDRMEIIQVSGYSLEEKVEIVQKHLVPKQLKEHGLKPEHVTISDEVMANIIEGYTKESGVRSLERQVAGVMRYVAKNVAMEKAYEKAVQPNQLKDILGAKVFSNDKYQEEEVPGVVVGLAWTSVGGDILFIEASLSKGKGALTLTGNLGDVMKESATTALSYLKAHAEDYGIDSEVFEKTNIHIHVPQGAIPKDGPSAGVTMLTALTSAFTKKPVKPRIAMTGEITLRGKVLPVGGIKEKMLAARRAGIDTIILCHENKKNVDEINADYIKGMKFHYVKKMSEVLALAL